MRVHDITVAGDFSSDDLKRLSLDAAQFDSDIVLKVLGRSIDVKSLLGMLLFPIRKGTVVTVQTKGKDEEEALHFMCGQLEA